MNLSLHWIFLASHVGRVAVSLCFHPGSTGKCCVDVKILYNTFFPHEDSIYRNFLSFLHTFLKDVCVYFIEMSTTQFFFRLLPLGVATAGHLLPSHSIPNVLLSHQPFARPPSLHPWSSSEDFIFSSCLAVSYSTSFVWYIHYMSSEHVNSTSELLF